jgi:hypothetical protein
MQTVMHYLLSTLFCSSTLHLDGNHGLAGLILLKRADDRILPQLPVP